MLNVYIHIEMNNVFIQQGYIFPENVTGYNQVNKEI